ncbi:MAG: hypothetical protein N2Z72_07825 [Bacteroidales bacterium]|nr:hypothetical protein [Bacteroidales bacterium]
MLILLGVLLSVSCQHSRHKLMNCGKLNTDTFLLDEDTILTPYYLPSTCGQKKQFPTLILIDPQGKPENQMLSYISLAEKHQFHLIGFKSYQNGKNTIELINIFTHWWKRAQEIFPIDTSRIYMAGFSGGARFVTLLVQKNLIKPRGILLAGWVTPEILNLPMTMVMTCGIRDFNYEHFLNIFTHSLPLHVHFIFFDGKHQWPDTLVLEQSFSLLNSNPTILSVENITQQLKTWMNEKKWELVYLNLPYLSSILSKKFLDSVQLILNQEFSFDIYLKNFQFEQQIRQNLLTHISNGDTNFFKTWLDSISQLERKNIQFTDYNKLERLKSFAGIALYSITKNALDKKQSSIWSYLRMYEILEPNNTEMMILHAAFFSEQKKCNQAKIWLEKAYQNGFDDQKRLRQMPEFMFCKSELFNR